MIIRRVCHHSQPRSYQSPETGMLLQLLFMMDCNVTFSYFATPTRFSVFLPNTFVKFLNFLSDDCLRAESTLNLLEVADLLLPGLPLAPSDSLLSKPLSDMDLAQATRRWLSFSWSLVSCLEGGCLTLAMASVFCRDLWISFASSAMVETRHTTFFAFSNWPLWRPDNDKIVFVINNVSRKVVDLLPGRLCLWIFPWLLRLNFSLNLLCWSDNWTWALWDQPVSVSHQDCRNFPHQEPSVDTQILLLSLMPPYISWMNL